MKHKTRLPRLTYFNQQLIPGLRLELLMAIVTTATDLCEEIRATGTHECWKQLAHALDAWEETNG